MYEENTDNQFNLIKKSIKKSEIILFIMDFLRNEHLDKSLITLEEETNLSLFNYSKEILVLRNLIIGGNWQESEEVLNSIFYEKQNKEDLKKCMFELKKEQFLEAVEIVPNSNNNNNDVEALVRQLKVIQSLCCKEEFEKLLGVLSKTPSITEQPEFRDWTPISGRLAAFEKIREIFGKIEKIKEERKIEENLMIDVLKAVYVLTNTGIGTSQSVNKDNGQKMNKVLKDFLNEVDKDIVENNLKIDITIENDVNKNKTYENSQIALMRSTKNELLMSQQSELLSNNNTVPSEKIENIKIKSLNSNPKNNSNSNKKYEKDTFEDNQKTNSSGKKKVNSYKNNVSDTNEIKEKANNNDNNVEVDVSSSMQNVTLNKNLTTEDYASLGQGYASFSSYEPSSLGLVAVLPDTQPIRTSAFSPRGDCLALGTNSRYVKIYAVNDVLDRFNKRKEINEKTKVPLIFEQKNHHLGSIYCIDWSISGRLIATGSNDTTIKLMVVPDLTLSPSSPSSELLELPLQGNRGTVRTLAFDPSSDLGLLAGDAGGGLRLWDSETGRLREEFGEGNQSGHRGDVSKVEWEKNGGNYFASGSADRTIKLWDLRELKATHDIHCGNYGAINDISLLNTGSAILVAAAHISGYVTVWNLLRKNLICEIKENNMQKEVRTVSFSPDGKYLICGGFDFKLKIYDILNNFEPIISLEHNDKIVSSRWHPDIPLIVSTSADKTARIWIPSKY